MTSRRPRCPTTASRRPATADAAPSPSVPVRAWQLHTHGEPGDVLVLDDVDAPQPAEGQVRLAVDACGVNWADVLVCRGTYQERAPLPITPGLEVVGRVEATGPGVDVEPGRRVLAPTVLPRGGMADAALAPASGLLELPPEVDDATAVALYVTYQTAWVTLVRRCRLEAGQTVLVHAGAGATGSAFIQVARALGATVLATAGGAAKVDRCRTLGAHDAADSRHDGLDLVAWVRERTGDHGADVVIDPVGGPLAEPSRRSVAFEGRLAVVGFASGEVPQLPANHVLVKNYDVIGVQWPAYRRHRPDVVATAHAELLAMLASGAITPLVGSVRPLDEALDVLDDVVGRRTEGKIVLVP